jgi:hypothetical protein
MLLAGALAGIVVMALHPDDIRDSRNGPLHFAYFFTSLLVVLGLAGPPDRLRGRAGIAAGAGFLALSVFVAVSEMGHSVLDATLIPVLRDNPATTDLISNDSWVSQSLFAGPFGLMLMAAMVLLLVGMLLVGVGTLVEGSYPRWPAVLLLLLVPTPLLPFTQGPIGPALLYLALAEFGYATLTGAGREPLPSWIRRAAARDPLAG